MFVFCIGLKTWVYKAFVEISLVAIVATALDKFDEIIDLIIVGFFIVVLNTILAIIWSFIRLQLKLLSNWYCNKKIKSQDPKIKELIEKHKKEIDDALKKTDKNVESLISIKVVNDKIQNKKDA